jgi:exportin-1
VQAYEQGTEDEEQFVQNLAMFLTTFLREHLLLIEGADQLRQPLTMAMSYLINISYVRNTGVSR